MELLPDSRQAGACEPGATMSRRAPHTGLQEDGDFAVTKAIERLRGLPSSSTFTPTRSRRGRLSWKQGRRFFQSLRVWVARRSTGSQETTSLMS